RPVVPYPYPSGERRSDMERAGLGVELDPREAAAERSLARVRQRAPELRAPRLVLRRLEQLDDALRAHAVRVGEPGPVVRLELHAVRGRPALDRLRAGSDRSAPARRVAEELVEDLCGEVHRLHVLLV